MSKRFKIECNAQFHHYIDILISLEKVKTIKQHSTISETYLIYYLQSVYGNKVQENKYLSKSNMASL